MSRFIYYFYKFIIPPTELFHRIPSRTQLNNPCGAGAGACRTDDKLPLGKGSKAVGYADGVLTIRYKDGGVCSGGKQAMETVIVLTCDKVWLCCSLALLTSRLYPAEMPKFVVVV